MSFTMIVFFENANRKRLFLKIFSNMFANRDFQVKFNTRVVFVLKQKPAQKNRLLCDECRGRRLNIYGYLK